uniref:Uncharacterized protein n=1 Tax=Trichuris muris TaxID=70415 RepID=A0A5S6QD12_TRIMR
MPKRKANGRLGKIRAFTLVTFGRSDFSRTKFGPQCVIAYSDVSARRRRQVARLGRESRSIIACGGQWATYRLAPVARDINMTVQPAGAASPGGTVARREACKQGATISACDGTPPKGESQSQKGRKALELNYG